MNKLLSLVTDVEFPKNRIPWVDNVKMVAILFVILGHTWRIIHCPLPEWLSLFILSFNMALFVIMTGYMSVKAIDKISCYKDLWSYFLKITKRILVPSAFFSTSMAIITALFNFLLTGELLLIPLLQKLFVVVVYCVAFYVRNDKKGRYMFLAMCILSIPIAIKTSSFWFFSMIWCVCISVAIASYLLFKFNSYTDIIKIAWKRCLFLYILSFSLSLIIGVIYVKTSDFVHFFIIGYVIARFNLIRILEKPLIYVFAGVIGLVSMWILGDNNMNFWDYHFIEFLGNGTLYFYYLRIITSMLISLFLIAITMRLSKDYSWFSFWGAQTLPLYLVHGMFVTILYELPIVYSITNSLLYLLYALLATIMLFYFSVLVIRFLMKYDITKVYCLGEKV